MISIPSQWQDSARFSFSYNGITTLIKTAWRQAHLIIAYTVLVFCVGIFGELFAKRWFSHIPNVADMPLDTYLTPYVTWAVLLFVPFLLQQVFAGKKKPYSFYLRRWLVWYVALMFVMILISLPVVLLAQFISDELFCFFDFVVSGVTRVIFWTLPFIVMTHLRDGGHPLQNAVYNALTKGLRAYWEELPSVGVVLCIMLPLFVVLYSAALYNSFILRLPYIAVLFYLYLRVFIAQVGWALLLAVYQHRVMRSVPSTSSMKKK